MPQKVACNYTPWCTECPYKIENGLAKGCDAVYGFAKGCDFDMIKSDGGWSAVDSAQASVALWVSSPRAG